MATAAPWKGKANSGGNGGGPLCPAGNWPAVCVALIDLGTQDEEYQGKAKQIRKVFVVWEADTDEGRFVLGKEYSLSFGPKAALRAALEKWRTKPYAEGEDVDLAAVLGKGCLLTIVHKTSGAGNVYAKADAVGGMVKGMAVPKPEHPPFLWHVGSGTPPPDHDWLPFIFGISVKDKVAKCAEMNGDGGEDGTPAADAADTEGF